MFPIYPQEEARHYCLELISLIESGSLKLQQVTEVSEERKNQGLMMGSLVCREKSTNKRVVLLAISGISKRVIQGDGSLKKETLESEENLLAFNKNGVLHIVVPSLVSNEDINLALNENDALIHQLTDRINAGEKALIPQRTALTDQSLRRVFNLYNFTHIGGQKLSLNQIINNHKNKLPPTGTGDCCAPKLLSYAFEHSLQPCSMDEVFYGEATKNKENGKSYAPCDERCGYVLPAILGLEVLYRDGSIVVVNKPSGLLSVPGKGEEKQDCVVNRIKQLYPDCIDQPSVHRLDMETSGILVLALTKEAHADLNRQFMEGTVLKKYEALLDGVIEKAPGEAAPKNGEKKGKIELSFRVDLENRPHQIYDEIYGKLGITEWVKEGIEYYYSPDNQKRKVTRVTFIPHTGRTHQLRLASSYIRGIGLPIIGDSLYGRCEDGERLMLHAKEITFTHPVSRQPMHFDCPPSF